MEHYDPVNDLIRMGQQALLADIARKKARRMVTFMDGPFAQKPQEDTEQKENSDVRCSSGPLQGL